MPEPNQLAKAELREITWNEAQEADEASPQYRVKVQFNPESLKVAYANSSSGGDQRGGSAIQFVGRGTTKLSLDLWFDVNAPLPEDVDAGLTDVRKLTERVNYFIKPKEQRSEDQFVPPGVRFLWGSFLFDGIMDSMGESLELFGHTGIPLRAKVSISLSSQEIQFRFNDEAGAPDGGAPSPGTQPTSQARDGDSVQDVNNRDGGGGDWRDLAEANDIEDPLRLPPGLRLTPPGRRRRR